MQQNQGNEGDPVGVAGHPSPGRPSQGGQTVELLPEIPLEGIAPRIKLRVLKIELLPGELRRKDRMGEIEIIIIVDGQPVDVILVELGPRKGREDREDRPEELHFANAAEEVAEIVFREFGIDDQVRSFSGADAYGKDAVEAVRLAKGWIGG